MNNDTAYGLVGHYHGHDLYVKNPGTKAERDKLRAALDNDAKTIKIKIDSNDSLAQLEAMLKELSDNDGAQS